MSVVVGAVRRLAPTTAEVSGLLWFAVAAIYILVVALSMIRVSYDIWGGLVLGPVLATLTLPILRRSVRRDDPTMVNLITAAFLFKMFGSVARYVGTYRLYDRADSTSYHGSGSRLAQAFWDGNFAEVYEQEMAPSLVGTSFIRLTTGLLYIVTGPTLVGGFIVYSLLSFLGLYLFYRALRTAFPEANHRRYAYLLFFLPSLLFWPSSIGKEAWMLGTLGLATYGIALILKHNALGYAYAGFGMAGTAMIRPHVTALCIAALIFAYIMRRRSWTDAALGPIGRVVGICVLLVAGGVIMNQAVAFFDVEGATSVDEVFERTERQSSTGGSEFEGARPSSPTQYPNALLSVLFRPYPWEAENGQMMVAALEGIALLLIFVMSWHRLVRTPGFIFKVPYVAYCVAFTAMFVFAFSSVSNFGNLTRQRTQVLPMVLVLLAIPDARRARDDQLNDGDVLLEDEQRRVRVGPTTRSRR